MDMFGSDKRGWNAEKSRLMMSRADSKESLPPLKLLGSQTSDVQGDDRGTDLLIQGLMDRLPEPNDIWSLDDRVKWLRTAASIFNLVYKASDGEYRDNRDISIVLITDNTPPVTELEVAEATKGSRPVGESNALSFANIETVVVS